MGGNYSDNDTAYALVRTFQNNVVTTDLNLTNPSQSNPNQQTITTVLNDILQALNSGTYGSCSAWLTGTSPTSVQSYISNYITLQLYGHGTLNNKQTAAFVGGYNADRTPIGVPEGWVVTINDQGAFFNEFYTENSGRNYFWIGPHAYPGNTLKARAEILIHELGHLMNDLGGAAGFQPDAVGTAKQRKQAGIANDNLVNTNCNNLIKGLR